MQPDYLFAHVHKTYFSLRIGLALLAALLPVLLVVVGYFWHGIDPQESLSHYYFALADTSSVLRDFPMRGWFVGILCAIGSFLVLYRGFSNTEDWLLNIAGASAIGVALVYMNVPPSCANCGEPLIPWWPWAHFFFAVVLFVCIAWVAWACSEETLGELPAERQGRYRVIYDRCAVGMLVFPLAAFILAHVIGMDKYLVLFVEALGIWVFAYYWYVKSKEIRESDADKKATTRPLPRSVRPYGPEVDREIALSPSDEKRAAPGREPSLRRRAARVFDKEAMH